eukprot:scaffold105655_cov32-Tisochrysis_lutea.AAC.1
MPGTPGSIRLLVVLKGASLQSTGGEGRQISREVASEDIRGSTVTREGDSPARTPRRAPVHARRLSRQLVAARPNTFGCVVAVELGEPRRAGSDGHRRMVREDTPSPSALLCSPGRGHGPLPLVSLPTARKGCSGSSLSSTHPHPRWETARSRFFTYYLLSTKYINW